MRENRRASRWGDLGRVRTWRGVDVLLRAPPAGDGPATGEIALSGIDILLVEDNPGDIRLIRQAFDERDVASTLHSVQTGDEALDWLYQRDEFAEAPRPDLVLLDLNLPAISGQTVLEDIKANTQLKRIPVIVLTGSESETELVEAYEAYANACLIKPVGPEEFADLVQTFADFWISTAVLAPVSDSVDDPPR